MGGDEGIQSHVHMHGDAVVHTVMTRRNALTNKLLLTLFWRSFLLVMGQPPPSSWLMMG